MLTKFEADSHFIMRLFFARATLKFFYEPTSSGAALSQLGTSASELKEIADAKIEKENAR